MGEQEKYGDLQSNSLIPEKNAISAQKAQFYRNVKS